MVRQNIGPPTRRPGHRSISLVRLALFFGLALHPGPIAPARAQEPLRLSAHRRSDGEVRLNSSGASNSVHRLESSADLRAWTEAARVHQGLIDFPAPGLRSGPPQFFRVVATPRTANDDWKNQVLYSSDPFLSAASQAGLAETRWIKFTLRLDEPQRVYFQDSRKYLFHYEFATHRLAGFEGMSPQDLDLVSLHARGQRLVFGAVVLPPQSSTREYGLEIVGAEPFPAAQVAAWFKTVRSMIVAPHDVQVFYFPTYEQGSLAAADLALLAAQGIAVSSPARWITANQGYSPGWALGRLVFVTASEINAAFSDGRLRYSDILLTDGIPAEIPVLAGVISTRPATPNSHVAILAKSFGVPFAFLARPEDQARLRAWQGQEILLSVEPGSNGWDIRTVNVQGLLTDAQRQSLLDAKRPAQLEIRAIESRGVLSLPVRDLTPRDVRYVGGKAANFGSLIRSIPDNTSTNAIAFTFDLWNGFLDQTLPEGKILRKKIAEKLAGHTFPPKVAVLKSDLAEIRDWIGNAADFSLAQKSAILAALGGFDARRKIRFRSSTNVEDTELFSGAGLYDSLSGCLLDDTDSDKKGPCQCDPTEADERGVFRALRRVYASFYNDNAFLERLRHGVNETEVGMGVLAHYSSPDEIELANGVATLQITRAQDPAARRFLGELVSQPGASSVANPEPNALPEVVILTKDPGSPLALRLDRGSSLLPLGASVLRWPAGYEALFGLLEKASVGYLATVPSRQEIILDFEYKKLQPDLLSVKQVREVPQVQAQSQKPPFVLNDAGRLAVFQHHGKDLFANHRLKSLWEFRSLVFTNAGSVGYNFQAEVIYHDGRQILRASGPIASFPDGKIKVADKVLTGTWHWGDGDQRRDYTLTATYPSVLSTNQPLPLSDATLVELKALYAAPQPRFSSGLSRQRDWVTNETTRLVPLEKIISGSLERRREFAAAGVKIEVAYTLAFLKFNVAGISIFDGKSFPLITWKGTTLTGFTTQPIALKGEFSQTYDSSRHNFNEVFLFEPRLEPSLDPSTRAELDAAKIKAILVEQFTADERSRPTLWIWSTDDQLRQLPSS